MKRWHPATWFGFGVIWSMTVIMTGTHSDLSWWEVETTLRNTVVAMMFLGIASYMTGHFITRSKASAEKET